VSDTHIYRPLRFFLSTYLITWISWFAAAYISYLPQGKNLYVVLMVPGLIAPFGVALIMILTSRNSVLRKQFITRLLNLRLINPSSVIAIVVIMPAAVVISILISTLFGESIAQFRFSGQFSFSAGSVPVILVLFLAASFEELGWRGYALDSLQSKYSYFASTMLFSVLWASWHFPLFFIKDYYQNELIRQGIWYALNFILSVMPMAFLIGWIWKKNGGSIIAALLFHFITNLSQEALMQTQVTKCIETFVLFAIAAVVVATNKEMFFDRKGAPHRQHIVK